MQVVGNLHSVLPQQLTEFQAPSPRHGEGLERPRSRLTELKVPSSLKKGTKVRA
jgi:hypothetical protein